MRRLIGSILFMGLLIGLAVLAALARPAQGPAEAATAPAASSLRVAAAPTPAQQQRDAVSAPAMTSKETEKKPLAIPAAPAVTPKWNAVAMAIDATSAITDAEALSRQVSGVLEVLRWDPDNQLFQSWIPDAVFPPPGGFGTNFSTKVGEPYILKLDVTQATALSIVGNVPAQTGSPEAVSWVLKGNASQCRWNYISLPLDHGAITSAEQLSLDIGNGNDVNELLVWDASQQIFVSYIPDVKFPPPGGFGTNFGTQIGYPYFVCVSRNDIVWP